MIDTCNSLAFQLRSLHVLEPPVLRNIPNVVSSKALDISSKTLDDHFWCGLH